LCDVFQKYDFILAGGTALSLQLGHRISVDLDFFTETFFSTEKIYREIKKAGFNPIVLQEEKGTLTLTINEIKVSLFHYPYLFLDEKKMWKGISIAGVKDIAAMKVIAITQRGARRDFIDLYFILQDTPFWKIAENMVRRFSKERINPMHIGKALVYFADAEVDPDPRYCGHKRPTWENVKDFFTKNIQQMVIDLQRAKEG
jgi:predicted nucleotidyltransferase component of viral defense system